MTTDINIEQVIQECINNAPETYLDEIRETIEKTTGTRIGVTTIWRFLRCSGFTLKKVRFLSFFDY